MNHRSYKQHERKVKTKSRVPRNKNQLVPSWAAKMPNPNQRWAKSYLEGHFLTFPKAGQTAIEASIYKRCFNIKIHLKKTNINPIVVYAYIFIWTEQAT